MMNNALSLLGDIFAAQRIIVRNVTATDTVAKGVYALDVTALDTDTSGATDVTRAILGNLVAVATANLGGVMLITPKIIKAGETGEAVFTGVQKVKVNANATNIAKGDRLKASNASSVLTKASSAVGSTDIGVACALQASTTDGDFIYVLFDGISFNKVINGAVS